MRIVLAHATNADARCVVPMGATQPDEGLQGVNLGNGLTVATVRLTLRVHTAGEPDGTFACDRVLNVPRDVPSIRLPKGMAQTIDIYGEAFAPLQSGETAPRRVAVGSLLGVSLTASKLADLRLYPDERFRCSNSALHRPRAFHSATLLPNGKVLIVGGLTPTPDANEESFGAGAVFITSEAEVYDPVDGTFTPVIEDDAPVPRAYHNAAFVGTTPEGNYQLLLVGGATADATMAAFGINTGAAPGTRIVPFDTSGSFPNPLMTAAATAELMIYNPATNSATRGPFAGFTPGVYQGATALPDGLAVAGGIDWMNMPLQMTIPTVKRAEVSRALEAPRFVALATPRMGASMTALGDDSALVWGGQIAPADPAGELVTGLAAGGTVKVTPLTLATAPPTQFHTATLLPADSATPNRTLLVTGGFVETTMNNGQALQPPTPMQAVRILTVTPGGGVSSTGPVLSSYTYDAGCNMPTRYRAAGWESAVAVGRGRVLVTGGSPTVTGTCVDCEGGSDFRCATAQASMFTAPATLAPTTERMQIPRYGHTSTLMNDGNVLIVGGVTTAVENPRMLRDVEVYNPRPVVPLFDASSGRPDPDDPAAADLAKASQARAPGQPLSEPTLCGEL
ncbi:MAG: branched-chain amino acid transporter substrate-binding protein [Myxococcales bacterium]|nr:branched-chain amino acid transporter substrate-binding protein [Myxococcales bacterium]